MNISHQDSLLTRSLRIAKTACALTALATVSACSSVTSHFKTTTSPLPIEILDSTGGEVTGSRAYEFSDRLYVSGRMEKSFGRHIPCTAHVDVQLVDDSGRVVAEKQDDIDPPHPKSGSPGQIGYVASFPLGEARQASKIVVRYSLEEHGS